MSSGHNNNSNTVVRGFQEIAWTGRDYFTLRTKLLAGVSIYLYTSKNTRNVHPQSFRLSNPSHLYSCLRSWWGFFQSPLIMKARDILRNGNSLHLLRAEEGWLHPTFRECRIDCYCERLTIFPNHVLDTRSCPPDTLFRLNPVIAG